MAPGRRVHPLGWTIPPRAELRKEADTAIGLAGLLLQSFDLAHLPLEAAVCCGI